MIDYSYSRDFQLDNEAEISNWISRQITSEGFEEGEILFVFCDDETLHKLNMDFLKHDTLTDILSFDYGIGKQINGEIYISVDRVRENAEVFETTFEDELHRVIIHGILHFCGYKDADNSQKAEMRKAEERALELRNFQN